MLGKLRTYHSFKHSLSLEHGPGHSSVWCVFRLCFMQFPKQAVIEGQAKVRMLGKLLNPVTKGY